MLNKISAVCLALLSTNLYADNTLIFSVDIIRHGERTPVYYFPNDKIKWNQAEGELTAAGFQREALLGKMLRQRYVTENHLLPPTLNPNYILVKSTYKNRTVASANAFLSGLYPEKFRSQNQGIHIYSVKYPDTHLVVQENQTLYSKFLTRRHDALAYQRILATKIQNLSEWENKTHCKIRTVQDLERVADNLYIRIYQQKALPNGVTKKEAEDFIRVAQDAMIEKFKMHEYTDRMGKALLQEISNLFQLRAQQKTELRYALFSSHDTTLMALMNSLNLPLDEVPHYASRINFSLYMDGDNNYFITLSYNDKKKTIPGCENVCSLNQFRSVVK